MRRRPPRAVESAAEVNHLRFEVMRLTQQAHDMAERLKAEQARSDRWEAYARKAWAELGQIRYPVDFG